MSEFIIFSDPHYYNNPSKSYLREDGLSSWLYEQLKVTDQIFEYAEHNGIKDIYINGDLFEEKNRINVLLYNTVWNYFKEYSEKFNIILNTGNHDIFTVNRESSLKPFTNIMTIITKPTNIETDDYYIRVIPFEMEEKNLAVPKTDKKKVLMTHSLISGLGNFGDVKVLPSQIFGDWDIVFNGHIHKPINLKNITNIGSITPQDWGEKGEQKRFIHYKDGEEISIKLDHPQFIALSGLNDKIRNKIETNTRDYFRIDIMSSEVIDPIFEKYNVSYKIVGSEKREVRLKDTKTVDEDMQEYIEIEKPDLDIDRLMKIGKEIIEKAKER